MESLCQDATNVFTSQVIQITGGFSKILFQKHTTGHAEPHSSCTEEAYIRPCEPSFLSRILQPILLDSWQHPLGWDGV